MSNRKTLLIVLGSLLTLAILGFTAYWFATKNSPATETAEPSPAPTPVEPSPTTTPSPSPTIKPTSTPKPTPKPTLTPPPPTPTPATQTTTVNSTSALDGFRSSNNDGNNTLDIRAGRNSNLTTRGFVSFDVPPGLTGKTIDSVTLRLYQFQITGSPYTIGGNLLAEHVDYGSSLDSSDYSAAVFDSASSTLGASNPSLEWKDFDVTTAFKNDASTGHSRSQYRLKFTTETIGGDVTGDFAYFYSSNSGSNTNPPQLAIKYH